MPIKILIVLLIAYAANYSFAEVQYDIKDPNITATMGDLILSANTIEMFWHSYNHPSRPITPPQAMQRIIDDALLAQYARVNLSKEKIDNSNKVGFSNDVLLEARAATLIRKAHNKELIKLIETLPNGNLESLYKMNTYITADKLAELMTLKSSLMINANPMQEKSAKETIVATLNFENAKLKNKIKHLTLWDIYQRQNVQGRLAIHKADIEHLTTQINQRVGSHFILAWADKNLSNVDTAAIQQILLNEQHKTRLLESMGLNADIHDDNPALRIRARSISKEKIKQYYLTNMNKFSVVEKVRARHVQVASQELADKVVAEIKAGLDFSASIEKYSIADDKDNSIPGNLGWLKRSDKKRSWLHAIAFVQQEGKVSSPFRSPQNQGDIVYEIIMADERIDGFLPYSDPTVRYEGSRDIAMKELHEEFIALQSQLRKNADIHLNKAALE